MKDVLGQALTDYHHDRRSTGKLWVHNKYGPKEEMPVPVYFRRAADMPELEWVALQQCKGRILDIGAGAGSHALVLQQMGLDVTALDISPLAAAVMNDRGVEKILQQDFFLLEEDGGQSGGSGFGHDSRSGQGGGIRPDPDGGFDTLLLLMNGIGLSGTLDGLRLFLAKARGLLRPGGRLIFDSSDIAYLYEGKIPTGKNYYGEILYQYEYKNQRSDWFHWLFIDGTTLAETAGREGWKTEVLFADEWDQYLVKCEPR
jgi:SAM-dependent methyltransferase